MDSIKEETGILKLFHYEFTYVIIKRKWNTLDGYEWYGDDYLLWEAIIDPIEGSWALGAGDTRQECLNDLLSSVSDIVLS
jgi:hypothetical protein